MLELDEAQRRLLATVRTLGTETVPLAEAFERVLAGKLTSPLDLPSFDNSAMDGYAVRAADVATASADRPVTLRLAGQVAAGAVFDGEVQPGTCVRLFTGSPMPRGADTVIMQEDTRVDERDPEKIRFLDAARTWENVRRRGEDLRGGAVLMEAGERLTAGHVALLAAVGLSTVPVGRRPTVGLVATGSELREPGAPLSPGQIHECNRLALSALCARAGARPGIHPLVQDTADATRAALETAFDRCDVVVTSGGASVGACDFVKDAFAQIGGSVEFWQVALKPGKPFVFGRWREKLFFGLPGNPVSAFVTFLLLVRPALLGLQGAKQVHLPTQSAVLTEPLDNPGGRRHFMRVTVDDAGQARSAGAQASHMLRSLAVANGLVDVPPKTTLVAGTTVPVLRWE